MAQAASLASAAPDSVTLSPRQRIRQIDQQIDANHRVICSRRSLRPITAADWQAAWDTNPDLREREDELYRQRGLAQRERDEADYKIATRVKRVESAKQRKASAAKLKAEIALNKAAPELLELAKLLRRTIEYQIRCDAKDGDEEGAGLKALTLSQVNETIARAEGR